MTTAVANRNSHSTYTSSNNPGIPVDPLGKDFQGIYPLNIENFGPRVYFSDSIESRSTQIATQIDAIQTQLNLGVTGIASVLGVSRQAIYKWLGGSSPEAPRKESLASLQRLSEMCERDVLKRPERTLDVKLDSGSSLREFFAVGHVDDFLLEQAVSEVRTREIDYSRSGIAQSVGPERDDWRLKESVAGNGE